MSSPPLMSTIVTPWALQVGLSCLVAQVTLTLGLQQFGRPGTPWRDMAAFTAHQIITVPVLLYLAVEGVRLQWAQMSVSVLSSVDRLTEPRHLHLSECVVGVMVFWDIPTGLSCRALREVPMVVHHVAMALTAALALGLASEGHPIVGYYAPFFFGVIEWSSLPLIVVDLFHPKHTAWHTYLHCSTTPPWWHSVNAVARLVFAASFLLLRTLFFPYVTLYVWYDVWTVSTLTLDQRRHVPMAPLISIALLNLLFSGLQLYWGTLLMQQIVKLVRGKKDKTK